MFLWFGNIIAVGYYDLAFTTLVHNVLFSTSMSETFLIPLEDEASVTMPNITKIVLNVGGKTIQTSVETLTTGWG